MLRRTVRRLCAPPPRDPFVVLGVPPTATADEIKKAHRRLALLFHPDTPKTGNKVQFQEVQAAFDLVKDGNYKPQPPPSGADLSGAWKGRAYDTPGSTAENYVAGTPRVQAIVRLVLLWCGAFVVLRFALLAVFPPRSHRQAPRIEELMKSAPSQPRPAQQPPQPTPFGFAAPFAAPNRGVQPIPNTATPGSDAGYATLFAQPSDSSSVFRFDSGDAAGAGQDASRNSADYFNSRR